MTCGLIAVLLLCKWMSDAGREGHCAAPSRSHALAQPCVSAACGTTTMSCVTCELQLTTKETLESSSPLTPALTTFTRMQSRNAESRYSRSAASLHGNQKMAVIEAKS